MIRFFAGVVAALILASVVISAADDGVSAARDLYAAAQYEDALVLLNRLRASDRASEDARAIDQYRAFCLLALGRRDDAEQAIAALVSVEPSFQPSDGEASPRVRSAFTDVRRRMLPGIVQQKYAAAKAAFDRKDPTALAQFEQVLKLLADPDISAAASQPPLSDLRTLASGFRDLSSVAAQPPPPPPAPVPAPAAPPVAVPDAAPVRGHIYSAADSNVVPPVPIRQGVPPFQFKSTVVPPPGALELVISETGAVIATVIRTSVHPRYDPILLDAARTWQYRPATLQGVPVLYRKLISIIVK